MAKTKSDIQLTDMSNKEKDTKTKPKKTKKVEPLEPKVETLDNVKAVADCVVDVEIDCRSYSNPSNQCVYIRRKRSI